MTISIPLPEDVIRIMEEFRVETEQEREREAAVKRRIKKDAAKAFADMVEYLEEGAPDGFTSECMVLMARKFVELERRIHAIEVKNMPYGRA